MLEDRFFNKAHFFLGELVAGIAGDIVGGFIGSAFQQDNMSHQAGLQKDLMKYQSDLQMENTRELNQNKHQWEVDDLKNAGLNPILSAGSSAFATAPVVSGSSVGSNPSYSPNLGGLLNSAINQEVQSKRLDNELKKIDIDKGKLELDTQIAHEATIPESVARQTFTMTQEERTRQQITIDRQLADKDIEIKSEQVKTIIQDRVNSIKMLEGQLEYWRMQGNAAMVSATAAMINAQANQLNAYVNSQVGQSIISKNNSDTRLNIQREVLNGYDIDLKKYNTESYLRYRDTNAGIFGQGVAYGLQDMGSILAGLK